MRTALLLGGFGFIGTNILKYIDNHYQDYQVVVFDRFPRHMFNIEFDCVSKVYAGDFSDEYLLDRIFQENQIDIVLHSLSASIPSSSMDNVFDLNANVIPTVKLLNVMENNGVKDIVFISSGGAVYGDRMFSEYGHNEKDVLYPKSAYGISKLTIEKYLYLYSEIYGFNSLVLRLSNPYGPYHYSQKQGVINIAIEKALQGEPLEIWGDGNGTKDYIYIEDFCRVLFALIEKKISRFNIFNIGSGNLLSVNNIVELLKENFFPSFVGVYKDAKILDVSSFKLDLNHLFDVLPSISFTRHKEGFEKTIDWYRSK